LDNLKALKAAKPPKVERHRANRLSVVRRDRAGTLYLALDLVPLYKALLGVSKRSGGAVCVCSACAYEAMLPKGEFAVCVSIGSKH
jgi:hypothetical protein